MKPQYIAKVMKFAGKSFLLTVGISVVILNILPQQNMWNVVALVSFFAAISSLLFMLDEYKAFQNVSDKLIDMSIIKDAIIQLSHETANLKKEEDLYELVVKLAVEVIGDAEFGSLLLLDQNNELRFSAVKGFDLEELSTIRLPIEDSYLYRSSNGNISKTTIINNSVTFNKTGKSKASQRMLTTKVTDQIRTTMSSPIFIEGKLHGMLNVDSSKDEAFSNEDIQLLEFFTFEVSKIIQFYMVIDENTRLSKFDSLTGLYNRRYFHRQMETHLSKMKPDEIFTIVSIDLDDLKKTNDLYGHEMGDQMILQFVHYMNKAIRPEDVFSRYGGDEFVIVFWHMNETTTLNLMNEVYNELQIERMMFSTHEIQSSFSYGTAEYPRESLLYKELIILADRRMYENKNLRKQKGKQDEKGK